MSLDYIIFFWVLGLLGMTGLFPVMAGVLAILPQKRANLRRNNDQPISKHTTQAFTILIPAHNAAALLGRTLESICSAIEYAQKTWPVKFQICVGIDGCEDDSRAIALSYGAQIVESKVRQGKWRTLCAMARRCDDSEWFILADVGVAWPKDFLGKLLLHCYNPQVMALAPSYRNPRAGLSEVALWWFESLIKTLEVFAGGPVSVHGATVCYRRHECMRALQYLAGRSWLNDDVVLPLSMRGLFPEHRILYLPRLSVYELTPDAEPQSEFNRRRRMVFGNLEWIRLLWPALLKQNFNVALLASRRIFRVFWAYWLLTALLVFTYILSFLPSAALGLIYLGALICLIGLSLRYGMPRAVKKLLKCAWASILAPYYLFTLNTTKLFSTEVHWK